MCIRDSKNTNQPFNWKANNTSSNLYQHYYGVQAAMNRGGDVWKAYNLSLIHI